MTENAIHPPNVLAVAEFRKIIEEAEGRKRQALSLGF
jgi:hypothetical protein